MLAACLHVAADPGINGTMNKMHINNYFIFYRFRELVVGSLQIWQYIVSLLARITI